MAKTIPQLTDATAVNAADELIIQQGGITKRATATELFSGTATVTSTSSTTGRTLTNRFADAVNVKDFGAVGDGASDDTAAIQAAISTTASGARRVYFPKGVYRTTSTITINADGVFLFGEGCGAAGSVPIAGATDGTTIRTGPRTGPTRIFADFTNGPVIRIRRSGCAILDMTIDASDERKAAALSTNYGIWVEGLDGTTELTQRTYLRGVRVTNQPSHGIVFCNNIAASTIDFCSMDNNAGHGLCVVGGEFHSRVDLTRPGQIDILNCRSTRNGGHGILVGGDDSNLSSIPYRVHLHNFESFFNLITTGLAANATWPSNLYLSGEQISVVSSAFSGTRQLPSRTFDHRLVYARGSNITFDHCRFISPLNNAVTPAVGGCAYFDTHPLFTSRDITVKHSSISLSEAGAGVNSVATAFEANSSVRRLEVYVDRKPPEVINLTSRNTSGFVEVDDLSTLTNANRFNRVINSTVSDNAVASYTFSGTPTSGLLLIAGSLGSGGAALVYYRVGDANASCSVLSSSGPTVTGTTGVLSGTTGVDGSLTISASTTSPLLYVENRTGAVTTYSLTFMAPTQTARHVTPT